MDQRAKKNTSTIKRLSSLPLPHESKVTENIHIGLIVPPSPFIVPCGWEWVHAAPFEGPSIIASVFKGLGYEFTLLDQRDDFNPESLSGKLNDFDLIGISTFEDSFPYIKRVIEIAREQMPDRPVLLGGSLVSSVPELIMKHTLADYAVLGEGELTVIELMDFITKKPYHLSVHEIQGLAWKDSGKNVIINKKREQMKNLDSVPMQDFSVWKRFQGRNIPEIYMSASRGCAFGCSFCYRTMPRLSLKSLQRVRREIEYLAQHNFQHVWWNDLCFLADTERVHELLAQAFTAHDFHWNCFSRVTGINIPVLSRMKEKGCDIILYGFEAISQDILNSYRKRISRNDMINAINLTRQAGIKVGGLFIIGAPDETRESLARIIEFCQEFKEITRVKYLSALPGTLLYKNALKNGDIKDEISHLEYLSREQSIEEDIDKEGFLFLAKNITKNDLRSAYRTINGLIETRPYDYENPRNVYLDSPRKFKRRSMTTPI